jgi:nanoRNase/pAp phosphatase (c-di-AMP/oligoRNAs hydrolase)
MMNVIITSGRTFVDIDALACAVAYRDFLKAKNIDCEVVFPGEINETVSETIKKWVLNIDKDPSDLTTDTEFVIVDCSNPNVFPTFAVKDKISEVYDHRSGYEDFWKGTNVVLQIELVGACATLIWEKIKNENLESKISQTGLNLLYTAIFANTLNFKSSVTTDRDKKAFLELAELVNLDSNWISIYYHEVESSMLVNPEAAIKNDTKIVDFPNLNLKVVIGQIELWNSKEFVFKNEDVIVNTLESFGVNNWFFTSPSISEDKNYIYTKSPRVIKLLTENFDTKFNGNWGETSKLWLRKEILRKLLSI